MRTRLAIFLLALALALGSASAFALSDDDAFMAAREAFQKGNIERLSQLAPDLKDYPLYPYVAYWQLRSRLPVTGQPVIEAFMSDFRDALVTERLRAEWLRQLGRNQDWEAFEREYRGLAVEDPELICYALQARLALHKDNGALKEARALWFQGSAQPDACAPLFDTILRQGLLEEDDVWARIRLALETGNVTFVRQLVGYLPAGKHADAHQFEAVAQRPQQYLERHPVKVKTRAERELALFAAVKLGQSLPAVAATRFEKIQSLFFGEEQAYVWAQLGVAGAMKHRPEALDWFARAGDRLTDRQLSWKVRAALRQEDWGTVITAIDAMSAKERQLPVWRYWKARGLTKTGRGAEGDAQLAALSFDHSFYGQLAMEELGTNIAAAPESYQPSADEIAAMGAAARHPARAQVLPAGSALRGCARMALDHARIWRQGSAGRRRSSAPRRLVRALHRHGRSHPAAARFQSCASPRPTGTW